MDVTIVSLVEGATEGVTTLTTEGAGVGVEEEEVGEAEEGPTTGGTEPFSLAEDMKFS